MECKRGKIHFYTKQWTESPLIFLNEPIIILSAVYILLFQFSNCSILKVSKMFNINARLDNNWYVSFSSTWLTHTHTHPYNTYPLPARSHTNKHTHTSNPSVLLWPLYFDLSCECFVFYPVSLCFFFHSCSCVGWITYGVHSPNSNVSVEARAFFP